MTELSAFYDRYIAAFNACDHEAFSACFHLPVTMVHGVDYDERRAGRSLIELSELSSLASRPGRWARTSIDELSELSDTGDGRPGIITTVTRWDKEDKAYHRIRTLYLLTREGGELGIKVISELSSTRLD